MSNSNSGILTIINAERANRLMSNYSDNVFGRNAFGHQDIKSWFQWGDPPYYNSNTLQGFHVKLSDFNILQNDMVGMTKFSFSFGLEDDTFTSKTRPRFTLLLQVTNDDCSIQSPYYQLLTPYGTDFSFTHKTQTNNSVLRVPDTLYALWTRNWRGYTEQNEMRASLCTIGINLGDGIANMPLRKYIFNQQDAINTLYLGLNPEAYRSLQAFICLTNHCQMNGENPIFATSRIGLLLGVATPPPTTGGSYDFVSSFYDFSAPCPPTCLQVPTGG